MYRLEVRSCNFILTDEIKNKYGSLLNGEINSYEVIKNHKSLGNFLHVVYNSRRQAYIYLSGVNDLSCQEKLYIRTLIED